MRIPLIAAAIICSTVTASAQQAKQLSPSMIAWGTAVAACLASKHAQTGCEVVHPENGPLVIWCGRRTPAAEQADKECGEEGAKAAQAARPAKWIPPK